MTVYYEEESLEWQLIVPSMLCIVGFLISTYSLILEFNLNHTMRYTLALF